MSAAADPLAGVTMSYDALVEAGRAARERADDYQWTEGDLALQVESLTPEQQPRDEQGNFLAGESALKHYADDIEVPYSTLQDYRRVAAAWPVRRRRRAVCWAAHKELAAVTDRFDHIRDGMTMREARELSRQLRGLDSGSRSTAPGWFELLGEVGDTLVKARKQLEKFEAAVGDDGFHEDLGIKAGEYAQWADDLAARLREFEVA